MLRRTFSPPNRSGSTELLNMVDHSVHQSGIGADLANLLLERSMHLIEALEFLGNETVDDWTTDFNDLIGLFAPWLEDAMHVNLHQAFAIDAKEFVAIAGIHLWDSFRLGPSGDFGLARTL
jgi:hypothetical protein